MANEEAVVVHLATFYLCAIAHALFIGNQQKKFADEMQLFESKFYRRRLLDNFFDGGKMANFSWEFRLDFK